MIGAVLTALAVRMFVNSVMNKRSNVSNRHPSPWTTTTYDFKKYVDACHFAYERSISRAPDRLFMLYLYNQHVPSHPPPPPPPSNSSGSGAGGDDTRSLIDVLAFDDSKKQTMVNVIFHTFIHNWRNGNCLLTQSTNKTVHHRINMFDWETANENGIYLY